MNAFICSTPIQIVRALYMKYAMAEFASSADMYIIPSFNKAQMIAENVRQTGLFKNVYLFETEGLNRAVSVRLIYGSNRWAKQFRSKDYEKVVSFNLESELSVALYNANKKNSEFEYHCVEDAPGLYKLYAPKRNSYFSLRSIAGITQPYYNTNQWWFSNPAFVEIPTLEMQRVNKLPPINIEDDKFVDMVNKVFEFSTDEVLECADILITEESFFTDKKIIDNYDYAVYKELKTFFNDKKIAVKLHPRTKINRFAGEFEIMKSTWCPWELYVMNGLRHNQHFPIQIGIACNTLVSDKFIFDSESPKIVLAPMFKDKIRKQQDGSSNVGEDIIEKYEKIKRTYTNPKHLVIAYNKDILFDTLKKWL